MKQRIGIAQALLNDPEVLIVDEPTAGLDPEERVRFRTLLASLTSARVVLLSTHIVLLSTHIVGDVEAVASRLIVLRSGHMLADTTPQALVARAAGCVWELMVDAPTAQRMQAQYQFSAILQRPDGIQMRVISPTRLSADARLVEPTLEEAYLLTVGRAAEAA